MPPIYTELMSEKRQSLWFHIFDVALNIVIILAVVGVIRTFLVSPFQVQGNSMLDTLEHRQYILINKFAYHVGTPERGDVVVLRPPDDQEKFYVKRVIGLPGDKVTLRDGNVFVRPAGVTAEFELEEPYLNEKNSGHTYPVKQARNIPKSYTVPVGSYFVLGDNRLGSADSRGFSETEESTEHFVPQKFIKGRVWYVLLPIKKIHAMEKPMYGF